MTVWTESCQASLSFTISQSLLKFMSIESVMPSNHLILCHPLLLLPSIFPSIRVFSNESALCIKWPKYWSFSFSPSNEYSGLISFRTDWFDLADPQAEICRLPMPRLRVEEGSSLYGPCLPSSPSDQAACCWLVHRPQSYFIQHVGNSELVHVLQSFTDWADIVLPWALNLFSIHISLEGKHL